MGFGLVVLALLAALALAVWVYQVPFDREILANSSSGSVRLEDRKGRELREVLSAEDGRARRVTLEAVSPHMIAATVHAEDHRFWSHIGVDWRAVARAAWQNARHGRVVSGASTLSQQVVKLAQGGRRSRAMGPKIQEAVLALRMERALTKTQILEEYLNRAPYGNQLFGVSAAAWMYFGKPPAQLSLAESAMLAGITRAPSLNQPYADRARARRVQVSILRLMRARGAISELEFRHAMDEELVILARQGRVLAPHFAEYVLREVGLAADPDESRAVAPRAADTPRPQRIRTTLDLDLQRVVQNIVGAELERLAPNRVRQAAVLVLDTRTNEVLAWVGSQDYWNAANAGANDGVLMRRQPGSALKPFVYGLYFERGHSAAEILLDFPSEFPAEKGIYIPKNYDGRYHGPTSAREALASSLNIPAVLVAQQVGVGDIIARLKALGMQTLEESNDYYGLGVALGNGEVRLRDLSAAYATLGRLGQQKPLRVVQEMRGADGSLLDEVMWTRQAGDIVAAKQMFSAEVAYLVLDILSDDAARARGFGRYSALYFPYRVAAKTGTSAGFRDNWAFGVTPEYTVGVWAGNFDGRPMQRSSGITGAAPIMRQVMQALYPDGANAGDVRWFTRPAGLESHRVCTLSGQKAGPDCPSSRRELFEPRTWSDEPCTLHRHVAIDMRNGLRATQSCPANFVAERVLLDPPDTWRTWATQRGEVLAPQEDSPLCTPVEN